MATEITNINARDKAIKQILKKENLINLKKSIILYIINNLCNARMDFIKKLCKAQRVF